MTDERREEAQDDDEMTSPPEPTIPGTEGLPDDVPDGDVGEGEK